MNSLGWFASR